MEYDINIPYSYGVSPIVLAVQVHEGDEQVERDEGGREKERIRNACVYKEREREKEGKIGWRGWLNLLQTIKYQLRSCLQIYFHRGASLLIIPSQFRFERSDAIAPRKRLKPLRSRFRNCRPAFSLLLPLLLLLVLSLSLHSRRQKLIARISLSLCFFLFRDRSNPFDAYFLF